ncbi:hypothetical protein MWN52_15960 [Pseudoxanthomonas winnipegensis]|uniref:hypothetical protein n=1 Tax=Pseudoxanthomonas winnipegensis TaxID=2480810 RepID=UPI002577E8D8|nr:hypothetical protein [Pseudoxanthomonas winnipegensis]WJI15094.1 hypothetical protein MWN52_15960 [Pseudoxanthomonas winnipegensis]
MIEIPAGSLDEWLEPLKPFQRSHLAAFLAHEEPEAAAQDWLSSTGSSQIIPFGGVPNPNPFWDRFRLEFRRFVCDDSAYVEEKQALIAEAGPATKAILISGISAAIGATIGYSATLLAPAVALLLYVIAKMGLRAYCNVDV